MKVNPLSTHEGLNRHLREKLRHWKILALAIYDLDEDPYDMDAIDRERTSRDHLIRLGEKVLDR